ncbi:MAG TPA: hypothetical protein VFE12_05160, partial [Acetobacteraceae bacterium]|nr:hypothetical protein [Acetobacteraceae bacterium]
FAVVYPWTCVFAAVVYAATAAGSKYLVPFEPTHYSTAHLEAWLVLLPQLLLLAPVWTALPRFIILGDERRRLLTFDYRLRRVVLVTLVLSAILMVGGLAFAITLDALQKFHVRLLFARPLLLLVFIARLAAWWLVLRLAIAPAMAAAGLRSYAIDTSFSFTRGWLFRIVGVRVIVYVPAGLLIGGIELGAYVRPELQATFNLLPWVAAATLLTGLTELADSAAMARIAVHIVRSRQGEDDGLR